MESAEASGASFLGCELRRQLAEQFAISARLYAEAVAALASSSGISQVEFRELVQKASEAQSRAEAARVAFEEHVASHQCEMLRAKSHQV